MLNPRLVTISAMIIAAAATRLVPHPPNFTAIGALALFGGAYFSRRWLAFAVPIGAMLISDTILTNPAPVSYGCFALTVALGLVLRERVTFARVAAVAIAASVLFFLLSNFSVWWGSRMYSQDFGGLVACYIAALPFAQNMLLGNLFYGGLLFGGMEALQYVWPALRQQDRQLAPVNVGK